MSASNIEIRKRKVNDESTDNVQPFKRISLRTKKSEESEVKKSEEKKSEEKKSVISNLPSFPTVTSTPILPVFGQIPTQSIEFLQSQSEIKNKGLYITPSLAFVLNIYEDCKYNYTSIIDSLKNKFKKYIIPYNLLYCECKEHIQLLLDNSPKAAYFRSKLHSYTTFGVSQEKKRISQKDLLDLIHTHMYDSEISGIENYVSPLETPISMTLELCNFLGIPSNEKHTRECICNKVFAYIQEHNLLKVDNAIYPDEKLAKVLMDSPIPTLRFMFYLRNHFLPDKVHQVQLVKTNSDGTTFVEESFYRNSSQKKHGPYMKYFPNGKIKYISYFKNDIEDGIHRTWYENGNLKSLTQYNMGKMNRISKLFDMDGTLLVNMLITDGLVNKFEINY